MRFSLTARALWDYNSLSTPLQARVDKQLAFLLRNFRHPSLRTKKFDEVKNIWQARITKSHRFYFRIEGDIYRIISIGPHPK